jgi:hypothetical protein
VNIPGNALLKPIVLTARLGMATKSATLNVVAPPPGANPTQL